MAGFFSRIFGSSEPQQEQVLAPVYQRNVPTYVNTAGAAQGGQAPVVPVAEYSLTDEAAKTITQMLRKTKVKRLGRDGLSAEVDFPVSNVSFTSLASHYSAARSHSISAISYGDDAVPQGDPMCISVELSRPATDYDPQSLQVAIQQVVSKLPALKDHVKLLPVEPPATYGDVWKQLKPLLHTKFSAHELAMLDEFFAANEAKPDEAGWRGGINASHNDGKVSVNFNAAELPQDKHAAKSSDEAILAYFHQHHDQILAYVKEKALALDIPELKAPGALDHLELIPNANGWNITMDVGTKATVDADPVTHQKYTATELAAKMTETPLSKVSTEKLGEIFSAAVFQSGKELPPITSRVIDGHLLAGIIRHRMGHEAAVEAVLAQHNMFKTNEQVADEAKKLVRHGATELGVPAFGTTVENKSVMDIDFNLPKGVKVEQVLQGIAAQSNQLLLEAQPRPALAAGVAA